MRLLLVALAFFFFLPPSPTQGADGFNTTADQQFLQLGAGDAEIMRLVNQDESGTLVQGVKIGAATSPKAKLDVEGGLKVGLYNNSACNSAAKGTLFFLDSDKTMYFCNGSSWEKF